MRDEIERLMRAVFDTNVEIDALQSADDDEATMRIERVMWPRLTDTHVRLVAARHAWPAEWASCLGAWCDSWQHWLRNEPSPTRDGDDAVERAAEGLGFLLGLDGARELRERRDVKRKRRRERDAEVAREAQETAASLAEFFGDASTARHFFTRILEAGKAGALYEAALRARLTCLMLDDADPLAEPLSRASLAILRLADLPDDRDRAEEIWSALERAIRALTDTVEAEATRVRD